MRWSRWFRRYGAREHALSLVQARLDKLGGEQSLLVEKGEVLLELGRDDEALVALKTAGQLASRSEERRAAVARRTGAASLALGQFEDAEREARKALNIDQYDVGGNQLLGAATFALGRFSEAKQAFVLAADRGRRSRGARARAMGRSGPVRHSNGAVRRRRGSAPLRPGDRPHDRKGRVVGSVLVVRVDRAR